MVKIPGTKEGVAGDRRVHLRRRQHQRDADLLDRNVRKGGARVRQRACSGASPRRNRSIRFAPSTPSSSAASTPPSTRCCTSTSPRARNSTHLLGKTGIANLKLTYQKFKEIFEGERFCARSRRPAAPCSARSGPRRRRRIRTYPDLMYVETVVGPDTVNTMPPKTIDALLDHGTIVADTVESDLPAAHGRHAGAAGREDLALRRHRTTADRRRHALLRLVRGAARRDRLQAEAAGKRRQRARRLTSGASAIRVRRCARHARARPIFSSGCGRTIRRCGRTTAADAEIIKKSLGWLDIPQHMLEARSRTARFRQGSRREVRFRRRLRHGRKFARARRAGRYLRTTSRAIRTCMVLDSTCPQQIQRARRADSHSRHALHHLEQERHDDRTERVLRVLSRESLEAARRLA